MYHRGPKREEFTDEYLANLLKEFENHTVRELATEYGCTPITMANHLRLARVRLNPVDHIQRDCYLDDSCKIVIAQELLELQKLITEPVALDKISTILALVSANT